MLPAACLFYSPLFFQTLRTILSDSLTTKHKTLFLCKTSYSVLFYS